MAEAVNDRVALVAEHGAPESLGIKTAQYLFLHQSPDLTVVQVIVPGYLRSAPHNHLVWAVIGMYEGCESNTFYRRETGHLVATGVVDLVAPGVIDLAPDVIHSIANPCKELSLALHVYGGPLANPARSLWHPVTLQEEPFQLATLSSYEEALYNPVARQS